MVRLESKDTFSFLHLKQTVADLKAKGIRKKVCIFHFASFLPCLLPAV